MALLSLIVISYFTIGVFVAIDLYPAGNAAGIRFPGASPAQSLRGLLQRLIACLFILMAWPLYALSDLSASRRYRMAEFVDEGCFHHVKTHHTQRG